MRISQKDKISIYNYSLWDRKCHLEDLINWLDDELLNEDSCEHEQLKENLQDCLTEIKSLYKFMHKIYNEINDNDKVNVEKYIYWDRVMK